MTDEGGCICSPHPLSHSTKEISQKASPWGEENCKQFVAQATDEGGSICTCKRHTLHMHPTHKTSAIAALSKKHLPPETKNFPQEHPYRTKRNNSLPCTDGCSWGKFSVSEGGLEGESPIFQEGALSLQGLLPSPKKIFKKGLTNGEKFDIIVGSTEKMTILLAWLSW